MPDISALDPNRFIKFKSPLRTERTAAILGITLGVSFTICFITGLMSHFQQHPSSLFAYRPWPANLYRVTQGLHVVSGLISIPILFAKLWTIFPKLFQFPPVANMAQAMERASIFPLIGGAFFMLVSGVANTNEWYFFKFFFTSAHYAVAYVTYGALMVHVGAKMVIVRRALREPQPSTPDALSRRRFLGGIFGTAGIIAVFTAGQSFSPLGRIAILAPRRPGIGPQGLPINKSAESAGVMDQALSPDYRLTVSGRGVKTPFELSLTDLQALLQNSAHLPISCVEGWSAAGHWKGVSVRDVLAAAGVTGRNSVRVVSLEQNGLYGQSVLNEHYVADRDTLLALELNGEPLDIQHGYPVRLIAPNRPGVLQTKWVTHLEVI